MKPIDNHDDIIGVEHIQWLLDPITKTLQYILTQHETKLIDAIANASMDNNLSDQYIRQLAVQLKTTKTIKKVIYDTPTFIVRSR